MKNKGLIVINGYTLIPSIGYCTQRLVEEFSKANIGIDVVKTTDLKILFDSNEIITINKSYDFCIFLDKDFYISTMLEKSGLKVFNSSRSIEICDDKMKTYIALFNKGIKMPKTISGPLNYSGQYSMDFIHTIESQLSYPIIIKENFGSQGSKVYMANNQSELINIEKNITAVPRLFQETIKESWGKDYRLIIIGNKYVAGMLRKSNNGDFRSNINLGGSGEPIDMPKEYIELAQEVSKLLGLDYCGIDLLETKEGPVLCEVNSNAFFKKAEEVTNINIAKKYVDYIVSKVY